MGQVKVVNNTSQRLELMLVDKTTKKMKSAALQPGATKFIDSSEITQQIKNLESKKLITTVEV